MPGESLRFGVFSPEGAKKVAKNSKFVDGLRNRAENLTEYGYEPQSEAIYGKLISRDPETGKEGFWEIREVRNENGVWRSPEGLRKWNGDKLPYVRHINWEDGEIGQVVRLRKINDVKAGREQWVFFTTPTNPEAFVLHADDNGGSVQALNNSSWTIDKPGSVLTNVGTLAMGPKTIFAGDYLGVLITFVDYGEGFVLADAAYTKGPGPYRSENAGDDYDNTIIVNFPLADIIISGDVARLKQHHAGDIHLEIFAFAGDEEDEDDPYTKPIQILGDENWINVTKAGRTWTIAHILPNPDKPKDSMKGFSKNFPCDDVVINSLADVQDWINNTVNANIEEQFWDIRGHTYLLTDCDGGIINRYDEDDDDDDTPEIYINLNSVLNAEISSGAVLLPNDVDGNIGMEFKYQVNKNGNENYTKFIVENRKINWSVFNSLGEVIKHSCVNIIEDGPGFHNEIFTSHTAVNVDGTSGAMCHDDMANGTILALNVMRFRFNDTATIKASVIGKGLPAQDSVATAAVTVSIVPDYTVIIDRNEPGVEAFGFIAGYSINDLGPDIYRCRAWFEYADGDRVPFSVTGQRGSYNVGDLLLDLDSSSTTNPADTAGIYFSIVDREPGAVIRLCTELVTIEELYNANVDGCEYLSYAEEGECITDETGSQVTDDSGDCIEDGGEFCWSDSFTGSAINNSRWADSSTTVFTSSVGSGVLNSSATATTGSVLLQQNSHSLSGEFNVSIDLASFNVGASGGHDIFVTATISGVTYIFDFRKNNATPTRGFYKRVGGVATLLQADASSSKTNQILKIERDGSNNLDFILNGSSLNTIAGVTGTVTAISIGTANQGAGATGTITSVTNSFTFEAPIGTPYCT